ncbi:hypothetical protein VAB18032_27596 [Micromonospora maris AB-18-032]|nr:hypothetical protein VAB18032_27596 [Micromonospora maris AB-18-032]
MSALRSCVQLYRPIGFQTTLSFLDELAGPFHREEAALLRALDALSMSRDQRRTEFRRYAAARRAAKRRGHRSPHPELANDPGSLITTVQVHHAPDELLKARIETIMSMLARYQVIA